MQKAIAEIKKNLRSWGFRTREISGLDLGYHILVNDKYRVKVCIGQQENSPIMTSRCDVVAVWFPTKQLRRYAKASETKIINDIEHGTFKDFVKSPRDLFPVQ